MGARTKIIISILFCVLGGTIFFRQPEKVLIFKTYDVAAEANSLNANLPYFAYNFKTAKVYEGIGNSYVLWEAAGTTEEKETRAKSDFTVREAFDLKSKRGFYYADFADRSLDVPGYRFVFFAKPHVKDATQTVYTDDKNALVIGLWGIEGFQERYLGDTSYPKGRNYRELSENLDYIPHIRIGRQ